MKYFGIFNETAVKNLKLNGKKSILIRIFEPNSFTSEHYQILNATSYQAILELYLHDYVKEIRENTLNEEFLKLNKFILQNDFDEIIIHCTLGVSRSPAIMICVAKILKNIELEIWIKNKFQHYNQYIVSSFEKFLISLKIFVIIILFIHITI